MLSYNLKIALKFLMKNRVFTVINVLGLSIALAVSFIIILYVVNELSFNRSHEHRKHVYRVLTQYTNVDITTTGTPYIMASALIDEFPQVKRAVNTYQIREFFIKHNNEWIDINNPIATSSDVFDVFTLPRVTSISKKGLLNDKNFICLSNSLAHKLFENGDAVGEELTVMINNQEQIFRVTAVFKDLPQNSTFKADCLLNGLWAIEEVNSYPYSDGNAALSWTQNFWSTWILLAEKTYLNDIDEQFRHLENKYLDQKENVNYSIQGLSEVYLKSENINNAGIRGNLRNVRLFSLIASLIVLVAGINYIVLSTAMSISRIKEIAIRKTNGAGIKQLIYQMLTESVLIAVLSLPIAIYLAMIGLPYAGNLFQKQIAVWSNNIPIYFLVYLGLTVIIGVISGLYTSVWLSRQKVMGVFRSKAITGIGKSYFRSALIVFQLTIFCAFVSVMIIVQHQYQYALNMNPGFQNENILFLDIDEEFREHNALLQELRNNPNVAMAGSSFLPLPKTSLPAVDFPHTENSDVMIMISLMFTDVSFLEAMDITLAEGRYFSEKFATDSIDKCILNQTAVRKFGLKDPIGYYFMDTWEVVGVVEDFYTGSIQDGLRPMIFIVSDDLIYQIVIRYNPGSLEALLPFLQDTWKRLAPGLPFQYFLVEDLIRELYIAEKNLVLVVTFSALFTLVISLFGLFGLTLFIAQRRTKEIGIKKVMGSSVKQIVFSFLRINLLYILIAVAVSTPITIAVMRPWLNSYAERIDLNWWFFALTFGIATFFVVLTVFLHSYKAAKVNPVEALRYE